MVFFANGVEMNGSHGGNQEPSASLSTPVSPYHSGRETAAEHQQIPYNGERDAIFVPYPNPQDNVGQSGPRLPMMPTGRDKIMADARQIL